jgi:hypothetical protein
MKTTLLLTDEVETTRLMLKDIAFDELTVRNTEGHAGCNCDRWGHPCPAASTATSYPKERLWFHHQSNSEMTKWST